MEDLGGYTVTKEQDEEIIKAIPRQVAPLFEMIAMNKGVENTHAVKYGFPTQTFRKKKCLDCKKFLNKENYIECLKCLEKRNYCKDVCFGI